MEVLLSLRLPEYVRIQTYADDIVVSLAGRSRPKLKERSKDVLNIVKDWGAQRTLQFPAF